jgi:hypothetical protein
VPHEGCIVIVFGQFDDFVSGFGFAAGVERHCNQTPIEAQPLVIERVGKEVLPTS